MNQQVDNSNGPERLRAAAGWLLFICRALALSLEVFFHKSSSFGRRALGLAAAAAALLIFSFPIVCPECDPRPIHGFMLVYLAMCLLVRVSTVVRRGAQPHSFYSGTPRLTFLSRWTSELTVKRAFEPLIAFLAGGLMLRANQTLGAYLMLAALGMFLSVNLSIVSEETRAQDLHDAYLDQRNLAEQFRRMRRE